MQPKLQCATAREAIGYNSEWDLQYSGWVTGHKSATNRSKNLFEYDASIMFDFKQDTGHSATISGSLVFKQGYLADTWPDQLSITSSAVLELDDTTLTIFMGPGETDPVHLRLVSEGCFFMGNGLLDKYQEKSVTYVVMKPLYKEAADNDGMVP
ncbi:hypothetical protein [Parendozoicomonas sp. Alg238-R29]|uniref:hypothetical protein n=1 Tax=Parendozoicomonas sp. Alg238-R29 TaxID=2993446 RepID=UPI00248E067A|nr:hypothetical protein [Parendozoicomonas sp. Alg238-R29]